MDDHCEECNVRIPVPQPKNGKLLCARCRHPKTPSCSEGGTGHWHADDDPSGATGSWDAAVKRYEEAW